MVGQADRGAGGQRSCMSLQTRRSDLCPAQVDRKRQHSRALHDLLAADGGRGWVWERTHKTYMR